MPTDQFRYRYPAVACPFVRGVSIRCALLLMAAAGVLACGSGVAPTTRPNVFLIVVDTLRADRLAAYGGTRGVTPFLDRFAATHQVVRRARAQAPWTSPSVASLMTSRFPSQHGIADVHASLDQGEQTLAETFHDAGYATAGFSANGLLRQSLGFGQGFDRYEVYGLAPGPDAGTRLIPARAQALTRDVLAWLGERRTPEQPGAPVFVYMHLMEPHPPYAPTADALGRLREERPAVDVAAVNVFMGAPGYGMWPHPLGAEDLRTVVDVYDASVAAADAALADLFAALGDRGYLDHAIVVVTADHGEEFQEHGARGHGSTLFDEVLRVPLLIAAPGVNQLGIVERVVSMIDVAPTVLALAGVPIPPSFEGRSFARDLDGGALARLRRLAERLVAGQDEGVSYAERPRAPGTDADPRSPHERALVMEDLKLIGGHDGMEELFDLASDPGERNPSSVGAAERGQLEGRLVEMQARASRHPSTASRLQPDAKTVEALRVLGYVEGR